MIGGLRLWTADFLDDAYITFQYARNISEGHGFIFTPRYPTWGTTTPLWTLLLAAAGALGLPIPPAAFAFDVAALVLQAVFVWMLFDALGVRAWAPAAIVFVQAMWSLPTSLPGMEYGLYAALCLGALGGVVRGAWVTAAVCAALAAVARPDGALVWVLCAAAWLIHTHGRARPRAVIAAAGILPLLWYGFALWTWGRLTPQTLATRRFEAGVWGRFWDYWLVNYFHPRGWVWLVVPVLAGLILAALENRRAVWVGLFFAGYTGMYSLFGLPALSPYFCPVNLVALAAVVLVPALGGRRCSLRSRIPLPQVRYGLLAVLVLAALWGNGRMSLDARRFFFKYRTLDTKLDTYRAVGRWLAETTPPQTTFAANEIGALTWFSRRDIVEVGGLVNPDGLARMVDGKLHEIIQSARPDLIILPDGFARAILAADPVWFAQHYVLLDTLSNDEKIPVSLWRRADFQPDAPWPERLRALRSRAEGR
ncbi:MAG: hypothetical protein Kow0059_01430 [Candidatus Sumerlaeia bacterium]